MTTWQSVTVAERWQVDLPLERVEGVDWANWERCRFDSMAEHLKRGDRLYDVGAEWGDISAVYARIVGGANLIPFEPHPGIWNNIRQIWERNKLDTPAGYYVGLVGAEAVEPSAKQDFDASERDGWPACAHDDWWPHRSFRYIHEHAHTTPQITLDEYAQRTELYPHALTIDVEGYELPVLKGAAKLLVVIRPLVWVSIHPDLMERFCGDTPDDLMAYMEGTGYRGEHLGTDHEEHWLFRPGVE